MDVELQILKHLKRSPKPTVSIVDRYCSAYNDLFYDVRNYECFKYLHQGIISPIITKIITGDSEGRRKIFTTVITPFSG